MPIASELADLFQRDLTRLLQQLRAFTDHDVLWVCPPGIANSAGNLIMHLEGNLREYVGRLLGGVPYQRARPQEFSLKGVSIASLEARIDEVRQLIPGIIRQLPDDRLQAEFPENPLGAPLSTEQFLIHLYGHFGYHLDQIDYLRRLLTGGTAIEYARL